MPKRAIQQRRKPKTAAPKKKPTPRETLLELIAEYRQKSAIGAKYYAQADQLLTQIKAKMKPGRRLSMGDGLYAVLIDLFDETDLVFKPTAMKRYELQLQDSSGRVVRMRDRQRRSKR